MSDIDKIFESFEDNDFDRYDDGDDWIIVFLLRKVSVLRLLRYCFHHNPLKYEPDYDADAL